MERRSPEMRRSYQVRKEISPVKKSDFNWSLNFRNCCSNFLSVSMSFCLSNINQSCLIISSKNNRSSDFADEISVNINFLVLKIEQPC